MILFCTWPHSASQTQSALRQSKGKNSHKPKKKKKISVFVQSPINVAGNLQQGLHKSPEAPFTGKMESGFIFISQEISFSFSAAKANMSINKE